MVIVKLSGGLGNQMFQYAAARALSESLRTGLRMDLSWFDEIKDNEQVVQRVYELDVFGIKPKTLNYSSRLRLRISPQLTLQQPDIGYAPYNPSFWKAKGNVYLDGYWQSEKYFKKYEDRIHKDFVFKNRLHPEKRQVLEQIESAGNPVSLHVRRGDYVNHKFIKGTYSIQTPAYYSTAIDYISKRSEEPTIFVISDDIEWCKKNIRSKFKTIFVDHIPGTGDQDMRLMSLCKHHIIANSSFSWWGAWLNPDPKKLVVAPKEWFTDTKVDTSDLIPETWHRL